MGLCARSNRVVDRVRTVQVSKPEQNGGDSNAIKTTRYTLLSFLPKNLWLQFHIAANQYFLLVGICFTIPGVTNLSPVTGWAALIFVLSVSAVTDAKEDYRRYKMDKAQNKATSERLPAGRPAENILCKDIKVGDIVRLRRNEIVPADIVLLASSAGANGCFVDTANLDGETSRRRDCHFDDTPFLSLLKHLLKVEGGATEWQSRRRLFDKQLQPGRM